MKLRGYYSNISPESQKRSAYACATRRFHHTLGAMTIGPQELTFVRNVHTLRPPGMVGSEHTPPSPQGEAEQRDAAAHLIAYVGNRALIIFRSPFTTRSKYTSLGIAAAFDEDPTRKEPAVVRTLYLPPNSTNGVDASFDVETVAGLELDAVAVLKFHLDALSNHVNLAPTVIMSGLAIARYFTGRNEWSEDAVDRLVPTGSVIHEGMDRHKGFVPYGLKADELAKYLEDKRMAEMHGGRP